MGRLRILIATLVAGCVLSAGGLLSLGTAHAAIFDKACDSGTASDSTVCQDGQTSQSTSDNSIYGPNGIITKVANIVAIIAGVAAVIIIIIAGMQYMLSTGDPTKVNNAKNAILYAVVGLLVVIVARALVLLVIGRL